MHLPKKHLGPTVIYLFLSNMILLPYPPSFASTQSYSLHGRAENLKPQKLAYSRPNKQTSKRIPNSMEVNKHLRVTCENNWPNNPKFTIGDQNGMRGHARPNRKGGEHAGRSQEETWETEENVQCTKSSSLAYKSVRSKFWATLPRKSNQKMKMLTIAMVMSSVLTIWCDLLILGNSMITQPKTKCPLFFLTPLTIFLGKPVYARLELPTDLW